jgi:hypothetical protein
VTEGIFKLPTLPSLTNLQVTMLRSLSASLYYLNPFCIQPQRKKGKGKKKILPATNKIPQMLTVDYKRQ